MTATELGQRFLEPGLYFKAPIDQISLGMALVFGTAGLPHILMRFFTVPTAQQARKSVVWAMGIIGGFYILTLFLGLRRGEARRAPPRSPRSMPAATWPRPLLAQYLGGGADSFVGNFMLAFVSAVAFATIVAVVAGLVLAAASAIAHDLYVGVYHGGDTVPPQQQVRAARIATVVVGAMAIMIGIAAKGQNVAHLVALAFAVAASANFPCVLLTLYWRRCSTGGIVAGMIVGTVVGGGSHAGVAERHLPESGARGVAEGVRRRGGQARGDRGEALLSTDAEVVRQAKIDLTALDKAVSQGEGRRRARSRARSVRWSASRSRCSRSRTPASSRFRSASSPC